MRAVYVDDEYLMLKAFLRINGKRGDMDILACFDEAIAALHFIEKNPVDIVFVDVLMPALNGVQLSKKIKKINPDIYVVFVTALEKSSISKKALYDDFMMKPFSEDDMNTVINNYYEKKAYM